MRAAVIGSRELDVDDLAAYLPDGLTEIVSGGARGIDTCARAFAIANGIRLTEFLPEYNRYGKSAPLKRNIQIIDYADEVIAIWDGKSSGTAFVIRECRKRGKKVTVFQVEPKV